MVTVLMSTSCPAVDALIVALPVGSDLPEHIPFEALGFTNKKGSAVAVPSEAGAKSAVTVYW